MKKLKLKLSLVIALCIGLGIFAGCKKSLTFQNVIIVAGTEVSPVVKFVVATAPTNFNVTAYATDKVAQNVNVTFAIDTTLVASYNLAQSSGYSVPPAGSYTLSTTSATIAAGSNVSTPVIVTLVSTANFVDGRSYIIPVTIKSVTGSINVLEASRTIYLKVARVTNFNSIDLTNYNWYYQYNFPTPINNLSQFTYEIKCKINAWHSGSPPISRLCNWGPVNQAYPNLLRFGEAGSLVNQLQWVSAEGSVFSNTQFSLGLWYTISCVYTGSSYQMYVNGVLDNTFAGAGQVYQFGALELGMSYAGYQKAQEFLGDVAEVRIWTRALSANEIQEGLCGVDPASNGLAGYWKMNEGSGQTFIDRTSGGRTMIWPLNPEGTPSNAPVVWTGSAANTCAQ